MKREEIERKAEVEIGVKVEVEVTWRCSLVGRAGVVPVDYARVRTVLSHWFDSSL